MKIAIVIPAYNEAKRIGVVLSELSKANYPVYVIDDGSGDETYRQARDFKVKLLRHKINLGKGAAIKTGCEAAFADNMEAVVMMDSDGQHKVSQLPQFVQALSSGKYDLVIGSRNLKSGSPLVRSFGNRFALMLVYLLFGIKVSDLLCGFRGLTRSAYQRMDCQSSGYGLETEMVIKAAKLKLRYCELPVETVYYDKFKGVTILDAVSILFDVVRWRFTK